MNNMQKKIFNYDMDSTIALDTNNYIKTAYKSKIEEDIKDKLITKGYITSSLEIDLERSDEEGYGNINNIVMKIEKMKVKEPRRVDTNKVVNKIDEVNISINPKNSKKNNNLKVYQINDSEIQEIKSYLNTVYGIDETKIIINE